MADTPSVVRLESASGTTVNIISTGAAIQRLIIPDRNGILKDVVRKNLSVRAIENLAKPKNISQSKNRDPDTAILERQLSESLGAKTTIKHSRKGGAINIKYSSIEELQGIIEKIRNS